jgi:hypothetical protein
MVANTEVMSLPSSEEISARIREGAQNRAKSNEINGAGGGNRTEAPN